MGSSIKGPKNPTTQTNTPKYMEEVATNVMQAQKVTELFHIMAIISLNMGNLNLEVSSLKNRLATWEKEKVVLQEKLDKEKEFQKGYKHNVKIWRKNRVEVEQNIKGLIKETETRPNGIAQEEEVQIKEPHDLSSEIVQEAKVHTEKLQKSGSRRRKTIKNS